MKLGLPTIMDGERKVDWRTIDFESPVLPQHEVVLPAFSIGAQQASRRVFHEPCSGAIGDNVVSTDHNSRLVYGLLALTG